MFGEMWLVDTSLICGQVTQPSKVISFQSIWNVYQSTTEESASQVCIKIAAGTSIFNTVETLVFHKPLKSWLKYV